MLMKDIKDEIRALEKLKGCPNVINIEGVKEDNGFMYVFIEYCNGGTLESLVK